MNLAETLRPVINIGAIEAELSRLSTDKLKAVFRESFGKAAEFIARAAICVKLMEERGESLVGIPQVDIFRRIASGRILPEVAWAFADSPGRVAVFRLPMPDQKKIAINAVYPVASVLADGRIDSRMVDLTRASKEVIGQVVSPKGLRSIEQQIAYLSEREDEMEAMSEAGKVDPLPRHRSVTVKLTDEEYQSLVINAARLNMKPYELARSGLLRSKVIEESE